MPPGIPGRKTAPEGVMSPKIYYPTMEEFKDFKGFIEKIEREDDAHLAGIVKIVPPKEWIPRKAGYDIETFGDLMIESPNKQKFNSLGDRGCYQTKGLIQSKISVKDYYALTQSSKYCTPQHNDYADLERKYWKSLAYGPPIYGCDVSTAISDDELEHWNIAKLDSILTTLANETGETYAGVNSAYVYFGMWKATFSWHVEDMDLYSINFLHHGAPKSWYCVPPKDGHLLEKACRKLFPNVASWCSNFMRHKTCLVAPNVLDQYGVPYTKVTQEERDIIIVFPYAYHSGFNHGYNIAESTNFALERWIEYGKRVKPCDCNRARVNFSMDPFVKKYQPEKYESWMNGTDIAPHPEDPPEVVEEIRLRLENPEEYERMMQEKVEKIRRAEEKRLERQKKKEKEESEKPKFFTYRHKVHLHVEVEIDVKSFTITRGLELLQNALQKETFDKDELKQMIENGDLYKIAFRQGLKRRKSEEDSRSVIVKEQTVVNMYKHIDLDGVHFTADPKTWAFTCPPNEKTVEFLKNSGMELSELFALGVFSKIGDCIMVIEKLEKKNGTVCKKAKLETKISEDSNLVGCDLYWHKETNNLIKINPTTMKPIEENRYPELENNKVEELKDEGILVFVGASKVVVGEVTADNVKKESREIEQGGESEKYEILDTSQDVSDDEEEDNKKTSIKTKYVDDELMEEDSDEEMFTSDESDESNDESSDDPDYFGTREIKEWKSTGNRAAKKRKKLKLRAERDARRAERKRRQHGLGGKKEGKKKKNNKDEINECFETTKKFHDADALPEDLEFTIRELSERDFGNRMTLVYVLRVMRCFGFHKKVSEEGEEGRYRWKGIRQELIRKNILKALQTPENDTEDVVANITFDMLKFLASSRKNIRVHLPIVAKQYEVDESRRILKIAAILEGIGLLETQSDDKGGVLYSGPSIYEEFCSKQHLKYAQPFGLKECSLKIKPVEIKEEYLYDYDVPQFEEKIVEESTELTEEEKRKAMANKDRVCTCGYTKILEDAVVINSEGKKVHSRSKVTVGNQRKRRCKKCTGCLTPPCKRCNFCLLPHLKKPCELRVCLYPVVPKCPCFR